MDDATCDQAGTVPLDPAAAPSTAPSDKPTADRVLIIDFGSPVSAEDVTASFADCPPRSSTPVRWSC